MIRALSVPVSSQHSWSTVPPSLVIYLRNGHGLCVRANARQPEPLPIVQPPLADANGGIPDSNGIPDNHCRADSNGKADSSACHVSQPSLSALQG